MDQQLLKGTTTVHDAHACISIEVAREQHQEEIYRLEEQIKKTEAATLAIAPDTSNQIDGDDSRQLANPQRELTTKERSLLSKYREYNATQNNIKSGLDKQYNECLRQQNLEPRNNWVIVTELLQGQW